MTELPRYRHGRPDMDSKYVCPCCGYVTLDKPVGDFDICPVCYWEADAVQSFNPTETTGPNTGSLECARRNFVAIGVSDGDDLLKVRPPLPSELPTLRSVPGVLTESQVQTLAQQLQDQQAAFEQRISRRFAEGRHRAASLKALQLWRHHEQSLQQEHGRLFDEVRVILTFHNPLDIHGLNSTRGYTFYDSQVEGILPWLQDAESIPDVVTIVYREFRRWFLGEVVGPASRYGHLATNIWDLLPHGR